MRFASFFLVLLSLVAGVCAQSRDLYDIDTIQKVSFFFKQANWKTLLRNNYVSRTYIRCDVTINSVLFKDAGVRYKGSSSYSKIPTNSEKQPYKVKLNAFVPGQDYQGYATLNFSNNFMDPTWIRETVGYYVFRQFIPAPKSNYLTLKINNVNYGPFVNTQQMNKSFMREWFPSDDGNRYKPGRIAKASTRNLSYLGASPSPYQAAYEIKNENPVAPWTDLIALTNALNNSGPNLEATLPRFMHVDSALRMNAGATVLLWLDSYVGSVCHNYFMCHEEDHDRFQFFPQDMNNSFGGYTDGAGKTPADLGKLSLYYANTGKGGLRPLQTMLLKVPAWRSRYIAHCREIARWMDWAKLKPIIDRFQAVVAGAVATDPKRLYPHAWFKSNLTNTVVVGQYKITVFGIKPVVDARKAHLDTLGEIRDPVNAITNLMLTPSRPTSVSRLQFTVKVTPPVAQSVGKVKLYWRIKGVYASLQMFDDGKHGDGPANDGVFGVSLPPQASGDVVQYYVESTVANNKAWNMNFLPANASFRPRSTYIDHVRGGPTLRINELMAVNATTIKDEANEFADWVEIYNSTNAAINVSGMYLSDDPTNPTKWKFPANQSIPARGTILVWCDNDSKQGPLHAGFKLDGDGEWLGLFDINGITLIDDVDFGLQQVDVSIGRLADGALPWVSFQDPSPQEVNVLKNRATACGNLRFSHLDSVMHTSTLVADKPPKLASTVTLSVERSAANSVALLLFGSSPAYVPFTKTQVLLAGLPLYSLLVLQIDAQGKATLPLPIPNDANLLGLEITMQSIGVTPQADYLASNALLMRVCPK